MAKTINDYKKDYADARAKGDAAGMKAANDGANAIRSQTGQKAEYAGQDIKNVGSSSGSSSSSGKTYQTTQKPDRDRDDRGGSYDASKPQGAKYSGPYTDTPARALDSGYYERESYYKQRYEAARAAGDVRGMREANDGMNQVRNDYGLAAQFANGDIEYIKGQTGYYGGGGSYGGGQFIGGGQQGMGDYAQMMQDFLSQQMSQQQNYYQQLLDEQQRRYDEIQAQQEAAKKAAVEQAVGQLGAQKGTLEQNYDNLYRQLYLDRRNSEKDLPQQLAAMGISGGLTESSALGLKTAYAEALRQGEQAKQGTLSDIDQAIANARFTGDISIAEQAAQTAMNRLASYGSTIGAMQGQDNWNKQFGYQQFQDAIAQQNWQSQFGYQQFLNDRDFNYQAGRDQVSDSHWDQQFNWGKFMDFAGLSRQQLQDEFNRSDTDYERKAAAAQYLYETTGDASLMSALGYSPDQIAALHSSFVTQQQQAQKGSGGGSSGGKSKPVLSYSNMMDSINRGIDTPAVRSAWEYYMGESWPGGESGGAISGYDQLGATAKGIASQMAHVNSPDQHVYFGDQIERALKAGNITESEADFLMKALGY